MTEKVEAQTLESYVISRGVRIISGTYKNEHSIFTFKCLACDGIYQKTLSAFKRTKRCPNCPEKDVMLEKLINLTEAAGFEYKNSFMHAKTQKFLIRKFTSEYVVNLRTLLNLLNLSIWDFYGLEPFEKIGTSKRPDRATWKCRLGDRTIVVSQRRLMEKLQHL